MARATFRGPFAAMAVVLAGAMTGACSEDQTACEASDALEQAITNVRQVELSDEEIGGLNGALLDLGHSLQDAKEAGAPAATVDIVTQEIEDLQHALGPVAEGEAETNVSLNAFAPQVSDVIDGSERVLDDLDC